MQSKIVMSVALLAALIGIVVARGGGFRGGLGEGGFEDGFGRGIHHGGLEGGFGREGFGGRGGRFEHLGGEEFGRGRGLRGNRFSEFGEGGVGGLGRAGRFRRGGIRNGGLGGAGVEGGLIGGGLAAGQSSGLIEGERDNFGAAGLAENRRGAILANKKGVRGSQTNFNNDDVGNFHKHNVVDKDTLIVKNNVKAVNDEDANHASHTNAGSTNFGAESGNLIAGGEEGRLGGGIHSDSANGILAGQRSELGAVGGAGGFSAGL